MAQQIPVVGRFAPSPSGRMHLGNAFSALLAWLSVRSAGGEMVLRQEDLDPQRCKRIYADQIEEDFRWLGLDWDRGGSMGGDAYYQSNRSDCYAAALEQLCRKELVYPCFCTRNQLHAASAPHAADGTPLYPGTCRNLSPEQQRERCKTRKPALRIKTPAERVSFRDRVMGFYEQNLAAACGDFILRRSDGVYAYQLAVVVDDAAMGVTEVVRGADLLDSTPRQLYLYHLLGLEPPGFIHFPLLLASDGRRLSKRDADAGLDSLRGRAAAEVLGKLAYLAGFNPSGAPKTAEMLLAEFAWDKVPKEDIRIPEGLF